MLHVKDSGPPVNTAMCIQLFFCILYYFMVEKVLPCSLMSLVPNMPLIGLSSTPFPF